VRAGVSMETLQAEAASLASAEAAAPKKKEAESVVPAERKLSRPELLAERYLAAIVAAGDFTSDEDVILYLPGIYRDIFEVLRRGERHHADPRLDERLNAIVMVGEDLLPAEREQLKEQIRREHLRDRRESL